MDPSSSSSSSSSSSASLSLVSRAKTAIHSAAAKAEKVLTDIKADLKTDRGDGEKGPRRSTDREIDASSASQEVLEKKSSVNQDCSSSSMTLIVPPSTVIRQLALAIESGKNFKSINDLLASNGDSSIKEKTSLSFSAVKSLVLRDKEEKSFDEELHSLFHTHFKSEDSVPLCTTGAGLESLSAVNLIKDLRGAPPESFIVQVSQITGGFKSLKRMASFWHCIIIELRNLWSDGVPIPRMPLDADPDLSCCLLHQQFQVINCSIARKQRRNIAKESLDSVIKEASLDSVAAFSSLEKSSNSNIYAKTKSGDYALRLGASNPSENLIMLETGEPIYSPVTQEGPVLTEELIKETEELVLRTGSMGAGCSQLLSDMQAFKAANPGCILEDFIRWHSPPDWMETEMDGQPDPLDGEGSSRRGQLSRRMQKEGNLWLELWEAAKPLPAVNQTPLFDEDLAVESILTTLEEIQPSELFEQLFASLLCASFLKAEAALPADSNLTKLFYDCKDYVSAAYRSGQQNEKLNDICKVYETVVALVAHPEDAVSILEQSEGTTSTEPKSRFKKLTTNFINKDRQPLWKRSTKDEKKPDEKHDAQKRGLSQIFDRKASLFSKKPPKSSEPLSASVSVDDEPNKCHINLLVATAFNNTPNQQ